MRIYLPKLTKKNVHRLKTITEFEMVVKELYQKGIKSYIVLSGRSFRLKSHNTYTHT